MGELVSSLNGLKGLANQLQELKNISKKNSQVCSDPPFQTAFVSFQLAAAMENMSYLVRVPEAVEQAKIFIETEKLLDAHKMYVFPL